MVLINRENNIMRFILVLALLSFAFGSETIAFNNPFKPGTAKIKFSRGTKTITRSTTCKRPYGAMDHLERLDSCVCCLLKQTIRPKKFKINGMKYIKHCLRKKHCNDYTLGTLANEVGMRYSKDANFKAQRFLTELALARFDEKNTRKKKKNRGFFDFFKRFKEKKENTSSTAPNERNRRYSTESNTGPDTKPLPEFIRRDREVRNANESGTFKVLVRIAGRGLFAKFLNPVKTSDGFIMPYLFIHDDNAQRLHPLRRYFRATFTKPPVRRTAINSLLTSVLDGEKVIGTTIRANHQNTVLVTKTEQ